MANTYTQIYIHIVFAVHGRQNLISQNHKEELYKYITGIVQNKRQKMMAINGMPDHIHLLISLSRSISLSDLVSKIKASSSRWIKTKEGGHANFAWQNGYGAFSIGQSGFQSCARYIANQKEHHKKISFEDELRTLFNKYQIKFDENYCWI